MDHPKLPILEAIIGRGHTVTIKNGPIDDTQVGTFTWENALRDIISNGLPSDSGGTSLRIPVDLKRKTAEIIDDGSGYSLYRHTICSTTKANDDAASTSVGVYGRGGTKEASLILTLQGINVVHRTRDWATLALATPYNDEERQVKLLEFAVAEGLPAQKGTRVILSGLTPEMLDYLSHPERNFLHFRQQNGWKPVYTDPKEHDSVLSVTEKGSVFIRGVKVCELPNQILSYDFTSIRAPINRERTKVDWVEVYNGVYRLLHGCRSPEVARAILTYQPTYEENRDGNITEWRNLARLGVSGEFKKFFTDEFYMIYGQNAILHNHGSSKNIRRMERVATALGKKVVTLPDQITTALNQSYGIPYDSSFVQTYDDLMWTEKELEAIQPGQLKQVDIPLSLTFEEKPAVDMVYSALTAQGIGGKEIEPSRLKTQISFVCRDMNCEAHVVPHNELGKFVEHVIYPDPSGIPPLFHAKAAQSIINAYFAGDDFDTIIKNLKGNYPDKHEHVSRILDIVKRAEQVLVTIPSDTPLDVRTIGAVELDKGIYGGQHINYTLAELAIHALSQKQTIVLKGGNWIAVPATRETETCTGKVRRHVLDTWIGVPNDGQYIALTAPIAVDEFLRLGYHYLSLRSTQPKVLSIVSSPEMEGKPLATILDPVKKAEIFAHGFLVAEPKSSKTIFTYNFSAFSYSNLLAYPSAIRDHLTTIIQNNTSIKVFRRILRESNKVQSNVTGKKPANPSELPLELLAEYDNARPFTLPLWRQAFEEEFGKKAVVATNEAVKPVDKLLYNCEPGMSYHALADRIGHKTISFTSNIEKVLRAAEVYTDEDILTLNSRYTLIGKVQGKDKTIYDLLNTVVKDVEKTINTTTKEQKRHYHVEFFTEIEYANGVKTREPMYSLAINSEGNELNYHIYINETVIKAAKSPKDLQALVERVLDIAIDDATGREFTSATLLSRFNREIGKAGNTQTLWQKLTGAN
ncbi:MAG: hypothetical protein WC254_01905 [Candidatus Woesearchaeota archaeon]|jgi:hypothetical protein